MVVARWWDLLFGCGTWTKIEVRSEIRGFNIPISTLICKLIRLKVDFRATVVHEA
jgi:hypothetical protein